MTSFTECTDFSKFPDISQALYWPLLQDVI